MSEYATDTQSANPILSPTVYFRVTAWALGVVALIGIVTTTLEQTPGQQWSSFGGLGLQFTWWHNALHVVLAAACALFGYAALQANLVKMFAIIFGAVYLILGILGFFPGLHLTDDAVLALTPTLNIVHILLGGWALTTGLLTKA